MCVNGVMGEQHRCWRNEMTTSVCSIDAKTNQWFVPSLRYAHTHTHHISPEIEEDILRGAFDVIASFDGEAGVSKQDWLAYFTPRPKLGAWRWLMGSVGIGGRMASHDTRSQTISGDQTDIESLHR